MLLTYQAILEGDKLKWIGAAPQQTFTDKQIPVYVTLLDTPHDSKKAADGQKMAHELAALAALDGSGTNSL